MAMSDKEVVSLHAEIVDEYTRQLGVFASRGMLKKKQREDLLAGFSDGVRSAFNVLCLRGHLQIGGDK